MRRLLVARAPRSCSEGERALRTSERRAEKLTLFASRWIGQDLAKYGPDEDLREVGTPPVQGVSASLLSPLFPPLTPFFFHRLLAVTLLSSPRSRSGLPMLWPTRSSSVEWVPV